MIARIFPGSRPTTPIMAPELMPSIPGQLITLYERITLVQGVAWGIDSYDQRGVELGKQMAKDLGPAIPDDVEALAAQDSSAASLVDYCRTNRKRDFDGSHPAGDGLNADVTPACYNWSQFEPERFAPMRTDSTRCAFVRARFDVHAAFSLNGAAPSPVKTAVHTQVAARQKRRPVTSILAAHLTPQAKQLVSFRFDGR